jgi:chromosome segregation ATPase
MEALINEIADKHDHIAELRSKISKLEEKVEQLERKVQFREKIIRELRRSTKNQQVFNLISYSLLSQCLVKFACLFAE